MFRIAAVLFTLFPAMAWSQTSEEGMAAIRAKDYETFFAIFSDLAAAGDAEAQSVLAWHYYRGNGTGTDLERAADLWKTASDAGVARATLNLAWVYLHGEGVRRDVTLSTELYEQAGEQGLSEGFYEAGVAYQTGRGVGIDGSRAAAFFFKAADMGNPYAELSLADAFVLGEVINLNIRRAIGTYESLNARRVDENLRLPDMGPRLREVERLRRGRPYNAELFRATAFAMPGPGESIAEVEDRRASLRDERIAARAAQIAAEEVAAAPTDLACSPEAPARGAVVDHMFHAGWTVTSAASRSAADVSFSLGRPKRMNVTTVMERSAAIALETPGVAPLGRIFVRAEDGTSLGPGWAVPNDTFLTTLAVEGNIWLDDSCLHRADEHMDEAQCEADAAKSFAALAEAISIGAEDLAFEYRVSPDAVSHSQPLELLAPAVYDLAERLVRRDGIWGVFPILRCGATP